MDNRLRALGHQADGFSGGQLRVGFFSEGVGCTVWGVGCGVWGVGCGVWGVGCRVWGVGCGVWGGRGHTTCGKRGWSSH